MLKVNLILSFVLNLSLVSSNSNPLVFINHNRYLGDLCTPANGSEGKCVKAKECTNIKSFREIVRCEFETNELIVCCPDIEKIESLNNEETTLIDIYEITYPPPKNLLMSRFNDILCENQENIKKLSENIVGGKEASVAEFPFQVALGYKSNTIKGAYDFNCGGSLILNDIVVTAAHCVHLKDVQPVIVRLGRTSLVEDEYDHGPIVDVGIKKIVIHEQSRRSNRQNDIALIQLDQKVEFTNYIKPICISKDNNALEKNLTITGFGIINTNTRKKSTWLMKGTVQEERFNDCQNSYKIVSKTIFNSHICALGTFGSDACQGDSGGPLILEEEGQDRLYGVTSHGNGCVSGLPALYTRVDKYLDWIEKNIMILDQDENLQ